MSVQGPEVRPLVIVGGGPAGMAAAVAAAEAGLRATIIDEAPALGGQIYRALPATFSVRDPEVLGKDYGRGEALRRDLARVDDRVEVMSDTRVLGIYQGNEVHWARPDCSGTLRAERLILATGAHDRSVAFPGWTLPGVMTAGGAQAFVKTMRIRPGERALVAGTGPLLLVVANQLVAAGTKVIAVLEAGKKPSLTRALPAVWGQWGLIRDALDYQAGLKQAGVPMLYNHTVFRAIGETAVTAVEYGPVAPDDWSPDPGQAQRVEVDLLVVGFGFVPASELAVLAGCQHRYVEELGGWVPEQDELMQTSVPGVFAVGDGAGVAGVLVAVEEGRVAGITAAEQAGRLSPAEADRRRAEPQAKLQDLQGIRRFLDEMSRLRPGLTKLLKEDTLLCRCEEVTVAQVRDALREGGRDLQAVKLLTRLGMGACQGRSCVSSAAQYVAKTLGLSLADVGRVNPRPPARSVTLGALAHAERSNNP